MLERELRNLIMSELRKYDFVPIYIINSNLTGLPDLLVITPDTNCFFVEVKLENNNQQPNQITIAKYLTEKTKSKVYVVKNIDEIKKIIYHQLKKYERRLEKLEAAKKWKLLNNLEIQKE